MCVKFTYWALPLKETCSSAMGLNGDPAPAGEEFLEMTQTFQTQTLQTHSGWTAPGRQPEASCYFRYD